jgi:hypothetical protein
MSDTGRNERHVLDENEADYFSSPLASPIQTPRSLPAEPSLGVYFAADEGETNDIIAALRASQRVIKEATENVLVSIYFGDWDEEVNDSNGFAYRPFGLEQKRTRK